MFSKEELRDFLDTGWMNDATVYYKGHLYWCEAFSKETGDKEIHFRLWIFPAVKTHDRRYLRVRCPKDYHFEKIIHSDQSEEVLKEKALHDPFWEGKSFWEALPDLEWLEEGDGDLLTLEEYLEIFPDAEVFK